jgi:alkylation response protein AidB-like acyl-CoA dehydrogenase
MQFFDHRREHARTDWDQDGRPRTEWRALISEMERRADKAGHLRYGLPKSCGDSGASNLAIAAIGEHLAAKGSACTTTCRTNRLCCEAADRAMQVHGGIGYSRALPFEHIYRHHRRYRITEGTEEVQMRRVGQYLFGFSGKRASKA